VQGLTKRPLNSVMIWRARFALKTAIAVFVLPWPPRLMLCLNLCLSRSPARHAAITAMPSSERCHAYYYVRGAVAVIVSSAKRRTQIGVLRHRVRVLRSSRCCLMIWCSCCGTIRSHHRTRTAFPVVSEPAGRRQVRSGPKLSTVDCGR
jgi:hypothetical protein